MTDPDDADHEFAGEVLDAALHELVDHGFDRLEAVRLMVGFGLSLLPAMCCRHHLEDEYRDLAEEVAERAAAVDDLVPGEDVAQCAGLH